MSAAPACCWVRQWSLRFRTWWIRNLRLSPKCESDFSGSGERVSTPSDIDAMQIRKIFLSASGAQATFARGDPGGGVAPTNPISASKYDYAVIRPLDGVPAAAKRLKQRVVLSP